MDVSGKRKSARSTRGCRSLVIVTIVIANFVAGILVYLHHAQHHPSNLAAQRAALIDKITHLNHRIALHAATASADAGLKAIHVLEHGHGSGAPPVPPGVATSGSSQAAAGYWEPLDPNPMYRMKPAAEVEKDYPELAAKLRQHAKNGEIMLSLANGIMICKNTTICWWNGGNILESFLTILEYNKITNYLIGVMDDETEVYLKERKTPVNWFRVHIEIPEAQKNSHPANQVSTIKYTLLKVILQLGYNVLITDMDLVYFKNPFDHLHRDADIEIQTDGFDQRAYGEIGSISDKTMGWGGGGLFLTTFTTNVGCMWVKSTPRSFKLMEQVSRHLQEKSGWDQQVFNEYLMRPAHADFSPSFAHLRVMDIDMWLNSKIFFRSRRSEYLPGASSRRPTPILVHMNYHPDKHKRMLCLMDRYFYGKVDACDNFPGGSEKGT